MTDKILSLPLEFDGTTQRLRVPVGCRLAGIDFVDQLRVLVIADPDADRAVAMNVYVLQDGQVADAVRPEWYAGSYLDNSRPRKRLHVFIEQSGGDTVYAPDRPLVYYGAWSVASTYSRDNVVTSSNGLFRALGPVTAGAEPGDTGDTTWTANWVELSAAGGGTDTSLATVDQDITGNRQIVNTASPDAFLIASLQNAAGTQTAALSVVPTLPGVSITGVDSAGGNSTTIRAASTSITFTFNGTADLRLNGNAGFLGQFTGSNSENNAPDWHWPALYQARWYFSDFVQTNNNENDPFRGSAINGGTGNNQGVNAYHADDRTMGIVRIRSAAATDSGYRWTTNAAVMRGQANLLYRCKFLLPDSLADVTVRLGFIDNIAAGANRDSAHIEMSAGVLEGITLNNLVQSTTATSFAPTVDTWYVAEVEWSRDGASVLGVDFRIRDLLGVELWSERLDTNLPTANGRRFGAGATAFTTAAAPAANTNLLTLDYIGFGFYRDFI